MNKCPLCGHETNRKTSTRLEFKTGTIAISDSPLCGVCHIGITEQFEDEETPKWAVDRLEKLGFFHFKTGVKTNELVS